jgi:hypothetical protein
MTATYEFLIDWDNDGGLDLGSFEAGSDTYLNIYGQRGVDGWYPGGTVPPTIELSTDGANEMDKVADVTASGENAASGEVAVNVIDNDPSTKWLVFTAGGWLQYLLTSAVAVVSYSLTSANDAANRDPKNWTLQGSNNGSSWTTLDTQTNQSFAQRFQTKAYTFSNSTAYLYYKLDITAVQSGTVTQLAEWAIFSDTPNRSYAGDSSLLVTWTGNNPFQFNVSGAGFDQGTFGRGDGTDTTTAGGLFPQIQRDIFGLTIGKSYTLKGWVYIPTGSPHLSWAVGGVGFGSATTIRNAWVAMTHTFTATATQHSIQVWPSTAPAGGERWWFDVPQITLTGEDVTARTLKRTDVNIRYGRDTRRATSVVTPAETAIEVNNRSRDYSPDNASSPLAGYLGPAKPFQIRAHMSSHRYTLFDGYLDDYTITPERDQRSVQFSAVDALSRLSDVDLSTELYDGRRTGELIHIVLDAAAWPAAARDIDPGATVVAWWYGEGTDALAALQDLVKAEGPSAYVTVDANGWFVFRDRHHRLTRTASTTSQATFRDTGTEPLFSSPMSYDIGWNDLVNSVTVDVQVREPVPSTEAVAPVVWEDPETIYNLSAGETRVINVKAESPFAAARTPRNIGSSFDEYDLLTGSVTVSLSRTSGQTTSIIIQASTAASIKGMALRAYPIQTARTVQVTAEHPTSIAKYGRRSYTDDIPWAGPNDVTAIADLIIGQRAERLPTVSVTVKNKNDTRLTQILTRNLSDRVTIVEAETSTNHDHWIEQIEHTIQETGKWHEATFGCERVPTQIANVFTFNVAGAGFDQGLFGHSGLDDPSTLFLLDSSLLDQGILGH